MTNCHRLKLPASDGKMRLTDVANAETLLRLVQSVPSPKAEPIKLWLAKVGFERMQEMSDPALALERARAAWQKHGRSEKWIRQRMTGQETRNKLTDYWAAHEIKKEDEYANLTNIIHQEWSGVSVTAHKNLKGLKTQNLRDHMSEAELILCRATGPDIHRVGSEPTTVLIPARSLRPTPLLACPRIGPRRRPAAKSQNAPVWNLKPRPAGKS